MALIITAILSKFKNVFLGKGRLIVEYLLIGAVVVLGTLCVNLYMSDREAKRYVDSLSVKLENQHKQIQAMDATNDIQTKTIENLQELRSRDAEALGGLVQDFQSLAKTNTLVDERLRSLEQNNEVVRKYLQSDIPVPLVCLLNNTCTDRPISENGVRKGKPK